MESPQVKKRIAAGPVGKTVKPGPGQIGDWTPTVEKEFYDKGIKKPGVVPSFKSDTSDVA